MDLNKDGQQGGGYGGGQDSGYGGQITDSGYGAGQDTGSGYGGGQSTDTGYGGGEMTAVLLRPCLNSLYAQTRIEIASVRRRPDFCLL